MQELSMNVLDVAQNSVAAGAKLIRITLDAQTGAAAWRLLVEDDGKGMDAETGRPGDRPVLHQPHHAARWGWGCRF